MKTITCTKALVIAISVGVSLLCITVYAAVTADVLFVGTIPGSQVFNGSATVSTRALTLKPGEKLPWHYHPGFAFNVVKSGTLTVEDGCGGEKTLTPGQGFEEMDGRVHRGKNLSGAEVVVYDTFIIPEGKPLTVQIPGGESRCGPPLDVPECRNDGWRKFTHPQSFTNQGQCESFVRRLRETRFQFQKSPY